MPDAPATSSEHDRLCHEAAAFSDLFCATQHPELAGITDIKVTSARQPQSSAPFRDFRQKIEGLGYHLMLFVYVKDEDEVDFTSIRFIPAECTADFQTTSYLRHLIEEDAQLEDLVAYLQDRQVPAEESSLISYAEELIASPPRQGYLTISNALQWRLQYRRVVTKQIDGVRDVRG